MTGMAVLGLVTNECHAVAFKATLLASKDGFSFADGRSGTDSSAVGRGGGTATDNKQHALLWNTLYDSLLDLNPDGFNESFAIDVSGNQQIGWGSGNATGLADHALLWNGTAAGVVDLHPPGFGSSIGYGVSDHDQVGWGNTLSGNRALL
jgi:hypothetical protein